MIYSFYKCLPDWAKDTVRLAVGPYRRYMSRYNIRNSWLNRKATLEDNHIEIYWNATECANRIQLIEILSDCINFRANAMSKGVLEYGSHVGINLKLLNDKLQNSDVNYYAVEPNREAIEFLKSKLNFVDTFNMEDEAFCRAEVPSVTISFVNVVFYCMSANRTKAVLKKLSAISEIIVIGDNMENLDGKKSLFKDEPVCYQHPYKKWLFEMGFKNIKYLPVSVPAPQMTGYIIAKRFE